MNILNKYSLCCIDYNSYNMVTMYCIVVTVYCISKNSDRIYQYKNTVILQFKSILVEIMGIWRCLYVYQKSYNV